MIDVRGIVRFWLQNNGYQGLYNEDGECSCTLDDLAPCESDCMDCIAGVRHYEGGPDWWIGPKVRDIHRLCRKCMDNMIAEPTSEARE